jgi:hypothetical protein
MVASVGLPVRAALHNNGIMIKIIGMFGCFQDWQTGFFHIMKCGEFVVTEQCDCAAIEYGEPLGFQDLC